MNKQKKFKQALVVILTVMLAGFLSGGACDDGDSGIPGADALLEECGFKCEDGIAEGNASITGIASIDGFFGAVTTFDTKATLISEDINAELAAIANSVGLEGGASADFAGEFQAAVAAEFMLDANAGIRIDYQEPKCEVSAKASIEATAKCEVDVEPGTLKASCSGSCEVDPGSIDVSAKCEGGVDAKVRCTGTAPDLKCDAECIGSCELEAEASCEGTCNGTCDGNCSIENADGSCAGQCDGKCNGSCELAAGGKCSGKCTGSCEYTPAELECEGSAKAEIYCEATAEVTAPKVECEASCEGEITPPRASAECEASAKAEAELNAECTPPSIDVVYEFDATAMGALDADAQATAKARFKAWLIFFKEHVGNIIAVSAKADAVIEAGANIGDAAANVILNAANEIDLSAKPSATFKVANCLSGELKAVPGVLEKASKKLNASVSASASLMGAID